MLRRIAPVARARRNRADQGDEVVEVALEHGHVVADERQRVVDLVGHAGDELAQAGELLGLDHAALRGLERLVRLVFGLGQLLEHDILLLELLFGAHPLGDVPEDALDADRLAVGAEEGRLHDLDVELFALGRDVLLDDVDHLPALEDLSVVAAILLGELSGEEVEVGLAFDLLEGACRARRRTSGWRT